MAAQRRHASGWLRQRLPLVPLGVALLSTTLGACASTRTPPAPSSPASPAPGAPTAAGTRRPVGLARESENLRLLAQLPGYGGRYYDSAGNLSVYVVDTTLRAKAIALFTPILKAHRPGGPGHVIVRQGQYDIGQLQQWLLRLAEGGSIAGLVEKGVDQAHNRIDIGIDRAQESQGRSDLARALAATGIPAQAVIVTATQPVKPAVAIEPIPRTSHR